MTTNSLLGISSELPSMSVFIPASNKTLKVCPRLGTRSGWPCSVWEKGYGIVEGNEAFLIFTYLK